ncbi:MAG: hypothetical protein ABI833_09545 [Acidobacteriota bacterium]
MKSGIKNWALLGLAAGALTAVGCGGPGHIGIYATTAPPPIRVETYGASPGPGYLWINGYWGYRGNNYVWTPGRWDRPPRGRRRWEDGRWQHRGNRYVWRDGRWR